MFAEPAGFDRDELVWALRDGWGVRVSDLRYEPVGFGTHHYRGTDRDGAGWFVNVDELAAKRWLGNDDSQVISNLEKALGTAAALREAGLEFVHAPLRLNQGGFVATAVDGYAVSLFNVIEGTSHPFGEFPTDAERREVLSALGRMHATTDGLPAGLPARDSLEVPQRQELFEALQNKWETGPYAERAKLLLEGGVDVVNDLFARYDALVSTVLSTSDVWVVTHGEPHAGNVMRPKDGGIKLIDWDTVALAPRERDLWMIEPRDDQDWAAYQQTSEADPAAIELYQLWWKLSEICGYVATFQAAHVDDANTRIAWRELQTYLVNP